MAVRRRQADSVGILPSSLIAALVAGLTRLARCRASRVAAPTVAVGSSAHSRLAFQVFRM
jgi:hypothetical protein